MSNTSVSAACCRIHGQDAATVSNPSYCTEHSQKFFATSHPADSVLPETSHSGARTASEAPPPKLPVGASAILRV